MAIPDHDIEQCLLDLLRRRAQTASICPSDVARTLAGDEDAWRAAMPSVRLVAARLARAGIVVITQGDAVVPPAQVDHGPVRLRRGPKFS